MIVAHVGPPTARTGGPAGYLHQLKSAASADARSRHQVLFPSAAVKGVQSSAIGPSNSISLLTRLRRRVFGPRFYRPPVGDLQREKGVVDRLLRDVSAGLRRDTKPSLDRALADADIVFAHEPFSAEDALGRRRSRQQVWMMCHAVMPMALYAAWSWALPEADWPSLLDYPDVRAWMRWERGIWERVDRFILPCPEAADSFREADATLTGVLDRADYVLSGAAAPSTRGGSDEVTRILGSRNPRERIGLYLGSAEPYRGFDILLAGMSQLPADAKVSIAVAGPPPSKVPSHPRLKALGRVEDVAALLASVDFLVNVNRFSLFDLSTIEAAESGKPLLLHASGGNRAFDRLGAGCVMIDQLTPAAVAAGLGRISSFDAETLAALGSQSRACWERVLTPRHMWEQHLALYDQAATADAS